MSFGDYGGVSYATKTNGTLWSWGYNNNNGGGQLGHNNLGNFYSSPTQIGTGTDWATGNSKLMGGYRMAACIKTDGTLWTWGGNSNGQCGVNVGFNPAYPESSPNQPAGHSGFSSPVQVPGTTWNTVLQGGDTMWAQKTDGTQWVWGSGTSGQMGRNDRTSYSSPVQVSSDFRSTFNENGSISGFEYSACGFKGT